MTDVPAKYQPEPVIEKATLYELYWGDEKLPVREIAERHDVCHKMVGQLMDKHGIPRRVGSYTRGNTVSPFTGFYTDQPARTTEQALETGEPDESQEFGGWEFTDWKGGAADD